MGNAGGLLLLRSQHIRMGAAVTFLPSFCTAREPPVARNTKDMSGAPRRSRSYRCRWGRESAYSAVNADIFPGLLSFT